MAADQELSSEVNEFSNHLFSGLTLFLQQIRARCLHTLKTIPQLPSFYWCNGSNWRILFVQGKNYVGSRLYFWVLKTDYCYCSRVTKTKGLDYFSYSCFAVALSKRSNMFSQPKIEGMTCMVHKKTRRFKPLHQ